MLLIKSKLMASRIGRQSMSVEDEEGEDEARVDKVASSAWSFN